MSGAVHSIENKASRRQLQLPYGPAAALCMRATTAPPPIEMRLGWPHDCRMDTANGGGAAGRPLVVPIPSIGKKKGEASTATHDDDDDDDDGCPLHPFARPLVLLCLEIELPTPPSPPAAFAHALRVRISQRHFCGGGRRHEGERAKPFAAAPLLLHHCSRWWTGRHASI